MISKLVRMYFFHIYILVISSIQRIVIDFILILCIVNSRLMSLYFDPPVI